MRSQRLGWSALVALVLLSPGQARAGLFAIVSWGDKITPVGDGGHEAWRLHGAQHVGFKYGHYAFFFLDLWTWGGTYCVYEQGTKKYKPIDPAEAARLLGKDPGQLETPSSYRFPRGWFVFGPLATLAAIGAVWREIDKRKEVALLFQDVRYQTALAIVRGEIAKQGPTTGGIPGQESALSPSDTPELWSALAAGIQYLISAGVAPEEAKRNLDLMVRSSRPPADANSFGKAGDDQEKKA